MSTQPTPEPTPTCPAPPSPRPGGPGGPPKGGPGGPPPTGPCGGLPCPVNFADGAAESGTSYLTTNYGDFDLTWYNLWQAGGPADFVGRVGTIGPRTTSPT